MRETLSVLAIFTLTLASCAESEPSTIGEDDAAATAAPNLRLPADVKLTCTLDNGSGRFTIDGNAVNGVDVALKGNLADGAWQMPLQQIVRYKRCRFGNCSSYAGQTHNIGADNTGCIRTIGMYVHTQTATGYQLNLGVSYSPYSAATCHNEWGNQFSKTLPATCTRR